MSKEVKDNENELLAIENNYLEKISNLTLNNNEILTAKQAKLLSWNLKKKVDVDGKSLANLADNILDKNEHLTNQEVAIELLKNVSKKGKNKFTRKLASKMLKEKWWNK